MHSTFSHDGTLTLAGLADWYRRKNYQFIALTEHAEDLDQEASRALLEECLELSSARFCVIPGVEFSCSDAHVLGIGVVTSAGRADALEAAETIHRQGGIAVLAHPKRFGWSCPDEILRAVDAVEIWNVGYDGKYLPQARATGSYTAMKRIHSSLLAMAGHDLHQIGSFYDVALEMNVGTLSVGAVLSNLRHGHYTIRSRFFRAGSRGEISASRATLLRLLSGQLGTIRRARSLVLELLP